MEDERFPQKSFPGGHFPFSASEEEEARGACFCPRCFCTQDPLLVGLWALAFSAAHLTKTLITYRQTESREEKNKETVGRRKLTVPEVENKHEILADTWRNNLCAEHRALKQLIVCIHGGKKKSQEHPSRNIMQTWNITIRIVCVYTYREEKYIKESRTVCAAAAAVCWKEDTGKLEGAYNCIRRKLSRTVVMKRNIKRHKTGPRWHTATHQFSIFL